MFCIKCGMKLDDSAKSCPACGTRMVFPEGFVPEQSTAVQPETVASNEPPHVPDGFDLSKANTSLNGKTILITDEPEIDLDSTMAAPAPKFRAPVAAEPVYQQPQYTQPAYSAPSPAPQLKNNNNKSKLPLIIAIAAVAVAAIIAAVILIPKLTKDNDSKKETSADSNVSENVGGVQSSKPFGEDSSKPIIGESDFEVIESITSITHFLVVNPQSPDYATIKQNVSSLKNNKTFEQIFESKNPDYPNNISEADIICYLPTDLPKGAFATSCELILSGLPYSKIGFEMFATQNDVYYFVAESQQPCLGFVSFETKPTYTTGVEFIPIYTEEIVVACQKDDAGVNPYESEIGVVSNTAAFRYAYIDERTSFSEEQFICFDTEEEMLNALEHGEIDCIITSRNHANRNSSGKSESIADSSRPIGSEATSQKEESPDNFTTPDIPYSPEESETVEISDAAEMTQSSNPSIE